MGTFFFSLSLNASLAAGMGRDIDSSDLHQLLAQGRMKVKTLLSDGRKTLQQELVKPHAMFLTSSISAT